MPVKALLFDVFGTVVNWEGSVTRLLEAFATREGLSNDAHGFTWLGFTRDWRAGYIRRTRAIAGGEPGPGNIDELHRELLDALVDKNPTYVPLLGKLSQAQRNELVQFWHQLDGWSDSSKGLEAVHELESGILTATLSNGTARLLIDLCRHGNLRFDTIFSGDVLQSYKPNPKMYLGASKLLGFEPGEVAMVAAHIQDLQAAASFGLKTIYVVRPTEDQDIEGFDGPDSVKPKSEGGEVDAVVRGLDELPTVLAQGF